LGGGAVAKKKVMNDGRNEIMRIYNFYSLSYIFGTVQ
jgi:hypothetical protein